MLCLILTKDTDDWVVIGAEPGDRHLVFQRASSWSPSRCPDPAYPQQLHLDTRVDDIEAAQTIALTLGAWRLPAELE